MVSLIRGVVVLLFFVAAVPAHAVTWYASSSEAVAACQAQSSQLGVACQTGEQAFGAFGCQNATPATWWPNNYSGQYMYGFCGGSLCASGSTFNFTTQACETTGGAGGCPATGSKTYAAVSAADAVPATACFGSCRYSYVRKFGPAVNLPCWGDSCIAGATQTGEFQATGESCAGDTSPTVAQKEPEAGTSAVGKCTKTTMANGAVEYQCGDAATGVQCARDASGAFQCSGGDSRAGGRCWTLDDGELYCRNAATDKVDPTTDEKSQTSTKVNKDGTKTETKTEFLPDGSWKSTSTDYDAAGNKTGESTESGSGVKNNDGQGDGAGAGGDGVSGPLAEPPSGTLPQSAVTLPGFTSSSYLGSSAGCPVPLGAVVFGQSISFSFEPACQAASMIRAVMIALALFLAIRIFQSYVREAV